MTRELTEELLRPYMSTDYLRPGMMQFIPTEWNGKKWCSATDGYRVILIPETEENKLPECVDERPPNISSVMIEEKQSIAIDMEALKKSVIDAEKALKELPMSTTCNDCYGLGEFTHGSHEYECQECEGSGEVYLDQMVLIDFGDRKIKSRLIKDLYTTFIKSGSKTVHCVGINSHLILLKTDNGIYILIAGFNADCDFEAVKSEIRFKWD